MFVERTDVLNERFNTLQKAKGAASSSRPSCESSSREDDPFTEVMAEITEQVRASTNRANVVIKESVKHFSEVVYSELIQEDLETRLKLVAAELSMSTTLAGGLSTVVEKAALKIQADARGASPEDGSDDEEELRDAKGDNILADLFGKSFKVTAWMGSKKKRLTGVAALDAQKVAKERLLLLDTLAHYASAASILAVVASEKRLDVVVCTEEMALHKASYLEPVGAWGITNDHTTIEEDCRQSVATIKGSQLSTTTTTSKTAAMLGIASKLKMASERGNEVVGSALTSSADQLTNTMVSFLKRTRGDSDSTTTSSASAAAAPPAPPARQRYVYSDAELAELEHQRQQILLEERTSKSTSAREIEQSVQEVSSLTGLMKERVAMQDEQLEVIMGNTQSSHDNISRANEELAKPLKSFWSSTRVLIALMWVCTVVLLFSHWVLR